MKPLDLVDFSKGINQNSEFTTEKNSLLFNLLENIQKKNEEKDSTNSFGIQPISPINLPEIKFKPNQAIPKNIARHGFCLLLAQGYMFLSKSIYSFRGIQGNSDQPSEPNKKIYIAKIIFFSIFGTQILYQNNMYMRWNT